MRQLHTIFGLKKSRRMKSEMLKSRKMKKNKRKRKRKSRRRNANKVLEKLEAQPQQECGETKEIISHDLLGLYQKPSPKRKVKVCLKLPQLSLETSLHWLPSQTLLQRMRKTMKKKMTKFLTILLLLRKLNKLSF